MISLKLHEALDPQLNEQARQRQLSKSELMRRALKPCLQAPIDVGAPAAPSACDRLSEISDAFRAAGFAGRAQP